MRQSFCGTRNFELYPTTAASSISSTVELRTDDGSVPAFAVGFVSVLAGTFLAAEFLKSSGNYAGLLDEMRNRAVFQFQNPAAVTNGAHYYPRDERCTACSRENAGARIW